MRRALFLLLSLVACGDDLASNRQHPTDVPSDAAPGGGALPPRDAGGSDAASDADAAIVYPDPLAGTSKKATLVKGGFSFTEGPVWIGGRLLFSDIPANVIQELLPDGGTTPFRAGTSGANGLAVDPQGRLLACQGGNKRVTRGPATKGTPPSDLTSTYEGKAYNAPNDVIVRADGNAYFTDPNYSGGPDTQDARAVYRIDPTGTVTRLAGDFDQPNGIALSPDGATLYVVDNGAGKLTRASVANDGAVGTFTPLADAPGGDGMGVDDAGNLYVASSDGVRVFDATGKPLGTVAVDEVPANCTFGGPSRRTLYVTARTGLYSIELNVPGLP